jgi:hypothetical protein
LLVSSEGGSFEAGPEEAGLPAGTTHLGFVAATWIAGSYSIASAQFFRRTHEPGACGLAVPTGGCEVARCPSAGRMRSENAGTIDVSALGSVATLTYVGDSPSGEYTAGMFPSSVVLGPGDAIAFTSLGGPDVPSFDASVVMPVLGQIVTPAFVVGETIATSADLDVQWEAIPSGDAVFLITTDTGHQLACAFDGPTGSGVVPQADLAALKALAPGGRATASFLAISRSQVVAGDWVIDALAFMQGGRGVGVEFGPVTLE